MLWILDAIVGVAIDVVGKESHGLHVWEQAGCVWQVLDFHWCEELACDLDVSLGEWSENIHVERYFAEVGLVFGACVGSRAQEVAEVGEDEVWHHGVEVDYA